jgi:hypothetical protein
MRTDRQTGRTKLTADFAILRMRPKIAIIQRLRSMAVQRPGCKADHSSLESKLRMLGVTPFIPEASSWHDV